MTLRSLFPFSHPILPPSSLSGSRSSAPLTLLSPCTRKDVNLQAIALTRSALPCSHRDSLPLLLHRPIGGYLIRLSKSGWISIYTASGKTRSWRTANIATSDNFPVPARFRRPATISAPTSVALSPGDVGGLDATADITGLGWVASDHGRVQLASD